MCCQIVSCDGHAVTLDTVLKGFIITAVPLLILIIPVALIIVQTVYFSNLANKVTKSLLPEVRELLLPQSSIRFQEPHHPPLRPYPPLSNLNPLPDSPELSHHSLPASELPPPLLHFDHNPVVIISIIIHGLGPTTHPAPSRITIIACLRLQVLIASLGRYAC